MEGFSIAIKPSKSGLYNVKAGRLWFRFSKMIGWRSNKLPPLLDSSIIPLEIVCVFFPGGDPSFGWALNQSNQGKRSNRCKPTHNSLVNSACICVSLVRIGTWKCTPSKLYKTLRNSRSASYAPWSPTQTLHLFFWGEMGKPWWLVGEWIYFLGIWVARKKGG